MKSFHRFFWTFNIVFAAFFALRSGFLLLFKNPEEIKTLLLILVFCLFYTAISIYGYHMYVGIKLFTKNRKDE